MGYNHPAVKAWKAQTMADGRKIHQQNLDRNAQLQETRLEAILMSCKSTWFSIGYNKEEVALLEEAWVLQSVKDSDKAVYRADKKKARQLQKQAAESLAARNK